MRADSPGQPVARPMGVEYGAGRPHSGSQPETAAAGLGGAAAASFAGRLHRTPPRAD